MNSFFHFFVNKLVYRYIWAAKVRTFFHSRKTFAYKLSEIKQFCRFWETILLPL
jgi:hypothetical protein